ncbi:MAG: 2-oxoglutarate dehydrogenase E1 subunit family protein, partial [Natronosporangium sp.]
MSAPSTSHENPLAGFGPNEWIVEDMYQRYLADPASVDPAWHEFFADYQPSSGGEPAASEPARSEPAEPAAGAGPAAGSGAAVAPR